MKRFLAAAAIATALVLGGSAASAQSIIRQPGQHQNKVEFEIHGIVGWHWRHAYGYSLGPGFRVGIPIVQNGFVRTINNSVAINFGLDVLFWPGYGGYASLVSPVMLQWNFYLTGRLSVFGEAGVAFEFYPFDRGDCRFGGCGEYFWLWPGLAGGARYHFGGSAGFPTLTMRLGFPTGFNIGVSF
jgi:opacity protein-like surface antigen